MMRLLAALGLASVSLIATGQDRPPTPVTYATNVPVPVTPPLWQGTPYVGTIVLLGQGCGNFEPIPDGMVLFVVRATASFNVAPGRGASAAIALFPLGATSTLADNLYIPVSKSTPVHQTFGVYDGYQGWVEIGVPTATVPQGCLNALTADDVRGRIILTGYLVPATQ